MQDSNTSRMTHNVYEGGALTHPIVAE